jgi:kojibiose phosphorylase
VYEEFEGYFALRDEAVSMFDKGGMPLLPAEVEGKMADTQLIKQADVVLLQYLLGDAFDPQSKRVNFEYYEPRTTHRSSLSASIYAVMGIEVGDSKRAYAHFLRTARTDLDDLHGNTDQGIHAAALGGTWQAVVNGFAGMRIREGHLSFDPWLPEGWERMAFSVAWRENRIRVAITREGLEAHLDDESTHDGIQILVDGQRQWISKKHQG